MTQTQQSNFTIAGAIGSLMAFLALVVIAFIPRPFESMDHFAILSGLHTLSPDELSGYKNYVITNFTFDSIYLIGHLLMWFGYVSYILKSNRTIAGIVAILGIISAFLDFTENEIRWSALEILVNGSTSNMLLWQTIFGLSFWVIFITALICGLVTLEKSLIKKVPISLAIIGVLIAPLSYKFGFLPAFLWLIIWHLGSAFFLWNFRSTKNA